MGIRSSSPIPPDPLLGIEKRSGSCRSLISESDLGSGGNSTGFAALFGCMGTPSAGEQRLPNGSGSGQGAVRAHIAAAVSGQRKDQDRFVISPRLECGVAFCAVLDGHGPQGHGAAEAAASRLPVIFNSQVLAKMPEGVLGQDDKDIEKCLKEALRETFAQFQKEMDGIYEESVLAPARELQKKVERQSGVTLGDVNMPQDSGTTASIMILFGSKLLLGWVGDSRAVLATAAPQSQEQGKAPVHARQLSDDHNIMAGPKSEVDRIKELGGIIVNKHFAMDTVEGMFMLTRSLGDVPFHRSGAVLYEPCFSPVISVDESTSFAIVASDGLWDSYTNEDAAELVASLLAEKGYAELSAKTSTAQKAHGVLLEVATAVTEAAANKAWELKKRSGDDVGVLIATFDAHWCKS